MARGAAVIETMTPPLHEKTKISLDCISTMMNAPFKTYEWSERLEARVGSYCEELDSGDIANLRKISQGLGIPPEIVFANHIGSVCQAIEENGPLKDYPMIGSLLAADAKLVKALVLALFRSGLKKTIRLMKTSNNGA